MMRHAALYDVVVVGGGPSGSTAAYLLASYGFKVCLVDKKEFPRPKLCAGLLTWKCIDLLNQVFGYTVPELTNKGVITTKCRDYRVYLGPKALVRRRLDFPFHFVDRTIYDHFWLRQAQQAGCQIITGRSVTKVDPIAGTLILDDGMHLQAKMIIGADGVWSRVRRSISTPTCIKHNWRRQLAATIETIYTYSSLPDKMRHASIHFGYLPWGYAWSFPGNGQQVVGICGLHQKGPGSLNHYFREFLEAIHIDTDQRPPWRSYPLPYGNHLRNPASGRVLLAGDACGLADPLLGEGIYYAHHSGEIAAQAIISSGLDATGAAANYRAALDTHILKELRWIKLYRNLLFTGGRMRRFHGLRLFFYLMPKRLEAAVQGYSKFSNLFLPGTSPRQATTRIA